MDDDVSAYSDKSRSAYERMLSYIAGGRRDGVIGWHMDRLHRRPVELERFVDTSSHSGVRDVVTLSGEIDLVGGDGFAHGAVACGGCDE
ncbi:recombinase family protein [Cellulomonas chengniuliangii]|uniref:recombinase family protein n=1 Tax=Cellulomonas chengniuliangii TaxID=2968084 RepID=UPI0027E0B8A6|nr:recombinase family protein [Cellulomonas chengniuliangii]